MKPRQITLVLLCLACCSLCFGQRPPPGGWPGDPGRQLEPVTVEVEGEFPQENTDPAEPVWRQAMAGTIIALPTIQAGTAVVVLDGGNLRAYTLEGKFLWDYYAGARLNPYVTRSREGTSYLSRVDGILSAVNRAGQELWRLRPGPTTGPIASGWDGRIFVPTETKLFCYTASGYQLWSRTLPQGASPVLGPFPNRRGGVVMALSNGSLCEYTHLGEETIRALGEVPVSLAPLSGGVLVFFKSGDVRLLPPGPAAAVKLPRLSSPPLAAAGRDSPSGGRGAALLASGSVVCFSVPDGKTLWTGKSHLGEGKQGAAAASSGSAELLYDERGVYALTPSGATGFSADGRCLWLLQIKGSQSIPVFSDNGMLFSGGRDWILYAYKLENRAREQKVSVYGPVPEGSYGLGTPGPSPWPEIVRRFDEFEISVRLKDIAAMIHSGSIGADEGEYTTFLMETAGAAMGHGVSETHPPVHVLQRAEAARLLGYIGSRETIPFLAALYLGDYDPIVKASAAEAIGRIGVDPDGIALKAFAQVINALSREEQSLIAAAGAIGSLCRFSGPLLSDSGIRLLNILSSDTMPPRVRARARQETAGLR